MDKTVDRWYGAQSDYQRDSADYAVFTHIHRFDEGGELKSSVRDGTYKRDLWATTAGLVTTGNNRVTNINQINDNSGITRGNQTRAAEDHHPSGRPITQAKPNGWVCAMTCWRAPEVALERTTTYTYRHPYQTHHHLGHHRWHRAVG